MFLQNVVVLRNHSAVTKVFHKKWCVVKRSRRLQQWCYYRAEWAPVSAIGRDMGETCACWLTMSTCSSQHLQSDDCWSQVTLSKFNDDVACQLSLALRDDGSIHRHKLSMKTLGSNDAQWVPLHRLTGVSALEAHNLNIKCESLPKLKLHLTWLELSRKIFFFFSSLCSVCNFPL